MDSRIDPHRNADHDSKDRCGQRELDGCREPLRDQIYHRLLYLIGNSKIKLDRTFEKAAELDDNRII